MNVYLKIVLTNLLNMTVLIIGGLVTCGLLTGAFLVWNGFNLSNLILFSFYLGISKTMILSLLIFHAPIELAAIFWSCSVGFRGMDITYEFIKNDKRISELIDSYFGIFDLILPTSLFLISGLIETLVINLHS